MIHNDNDVISLKSEFEQQAAPFPSMLSLSLSFQSSIIEKVNP